MHRLQIQKCGTLINELIRGKLHELARIVNRVLRWAPEGRGQLDRENVNLPPGAGVWPWGPLACEAAFVSGGPGDREGVVVGVCLNLLALL